MAIDAAWLWQDEGAARSRAQPTDTLVISNDDGLLIELGPLLGDAYRVHAVDTPAGIDAALDASRWIGILDADSQPDARSAISLLEVRHSHCPLIVISAQPQDWVDCIGCGPVLAAIGRGQVAMAQLREALLAAQDRLRADGLEDDATASTAPPDRFELGPPRRGSVWAAASILLLVLAANGVWLHHRLASLAHAWPVSGSGAAGAGPAEPAERRTEAAPADSAPIPGPALAAAAPHLGPSAAAGLSNSSSLPVKQQNVMQLLSAARVAFHDQRLLPSPQATGSSGGSALELYVRVLSQEPKNDEALDGVRRLLPLGRSQIMTDAQNGQAEEANRLLALFRSAGVDAGELRRLENAVSAERPKWLEQHAAQDIAAGDFRTAEQLLMEAIASGADASTVKGLRAQETAKKMEMQLRTMAGEVDTAVLAGALLQPPMDNALTHLAAMRSIGRGHPLTLRAEQEVQTALVQLGQQATRTARFDVAQRALDAAAELGSFAPISDARRQLQLARDAAARASAAPLVPVQRTAVTAAHAVAAAAAADVPTAASSPAYINARPTRDLPVQYPANANADGSVIVEFTLSAKGLARDATVVQSDPPGLFDHAAIRAVQHGHYSTAELVNGQPARARIKLRFIPPERWHHT